MKKSKTCCGGLEQWMPPRLFKALADPNRVSMLAELAQSARPRTVTDLAGCCPVDLSVVSRHLHILREAGVLDAEKKGKEVFYRVRIRELVDLLRRLADALEACCPDGVCPSGRER